MVFTIAYVFRGTMLGLGGWIDAAALSAILTPFIWFGAASVLAGL
jgi:hypothetical protein